MSTVRKYWSRAVSDVHMSSEREHLVICSPSIRWIQSPVSVVEDISQIDRARGCD